MSEGTVRVRTVAENTNQTAAELRKVSRATRGIGEEALWAGRKSRHSMSLMTEGFKGIGSMVGLTGVAFSIKSLADAGMNLQHQQAMLKVATGGNVEAYKALDAAAIKSSEHGGFSRDEELQSMTQLMHVTHSQTETLQANTDAVALARAEGLSFTTAQHYMNQAVVGNVNRLKQYIGYITPVKTAEQALGQQHKVNIALWDQQAAAMNKASKGSGTAWKQQMELQHGITKDMAQQAVMQDKLATGRKTLDAISQNPTFNKAQAVYANTLQGKVTDLKQTFQEVEGAIGMTLIPAMTKVVGVGLKIVEFMTKTHWVAIGLAGAVTALGTIAFARMLYGGLAYAIDGLVSFVGAVSGAIGAVMGLSAASMWETLQLKVMYISDGIAAAATYGLAAAQTVAAVATAILTGDMVALTVAMDANPIGLIILGVAALAVGIYMLITHFKDVKNAGIAAFHWILGAAATAWTWIKGHWELVGLIIGGPLGLAVAVVATHFKAIARWGENAFHNIKGAAADSINWIKNAWKDMTKFVTSPIHFGGHGPLSDVANFVMNPFGRFSGHYAGGSVGAVGGSVGATDTVPTMLSPGEGVLNRAAMQQIGDRGLNRLNEGLGLGGGGGGGGVNVTITPSPANFYVDGRLLARALVRYTLEKAARGPSSLSGGALVTGV